MNDIMIQVSLQDLLVGLLTVAGFVAVVFLIIVLARLAKTMKKLNGVMDDAKVITESVSDKVQKVDGVIDDTVEVVGRFTTSIKENEGVIKTLGNIAKACTSVINLMKEDSGK